MNRKKGKSIKKRDKILEEEALREEEVSIFIALGLTALFIVVGIFLGYFLYKLALNSSGFIMNYDYLIK